MSARDESLSTRDLASSPAEDRDDAQIAATRENAEPGVRDGETPSRGEPVPDMRTAEAPGDEARDDEAMPRAEPTREARVADESDKVEGDREADVGEPVRGDATDAESAPESTRDHGDAPLLAEHEGAEFGGRWEKVQVMFVDDPRRAVEDADELVANVMKQLAEGFAREREALEGQWSRGEDVSTEDLRVALQRYRSFFQRLLSA
jgi:hypothetical protein